ncbi:hypothetical protein PROFUN_08038 [Planoprotostelium fungivorum]|uniref:Uncharacterized protein n=1 Tax=Planoprotostelium fungivorum TaxID=1890364 RepID=A0A2P6NKI5_9EUKA|nr:hypothetical protein PROFUN_08038 [Planoprotostelium fungivorum]
MSRLREQNRLNTFRFFGKIYSQEADNNLIYGLGDIASSGIHKALMGTSFTEDITRSVEECVDTSEELTNDFICENTKREGNLIICLIDGLSFTSEVTHLEHFRDAHTARIESVLSTLVEDGERSPLGFIFTKLLYSNFVYPPIIKSERRTPQLSIEYPSCVPPMLKPRRPKETNTLIPHTVTMGEKKKERLFSAHYQRYVNERREEKDKRICKLYTKKQLARARSRILGSHYTKYGHNPEHLFTYTLDAAKNKKEGVQAVETSDAETSHAKEEETTTQESTSEDTVNDNGKKKVVNRMGGKTVVEELEEVKEERKDLYTPEEWTRNAMAMVSTIYKELIQEVVDDLSWKLLQRTISEHKKQREKALEEEALKSERGQVFISEVKMTIAERREREEREEKERKRAEVEKRRQEIQKKLDAFASEHTEQAIQAEIASVVSECIEEEKRERKKRNALQKQQQAQAQAQAQRQRTNMQSTSTPFVPGSAQVSKNAPIYAPPNLYHPTTYNPIPISASINPPMVPTGSYAPRKQGPTVPPYFPDAVVPQSVTTPTVAVKSEKGKEEDNQDDIDLNIVWNNSLSVDHEEEPDNNETESVYSAIGPAEYSVFGSSKFGPSTLLSPFSSNPPVTRAAPAIGSNGATRQQDTILTSDTGQKYAFNVSRGMIRNYNPGQTGSLFNNNNTNLQRSFDSAPPLDIQSAFNNGSNGFFPSTGGTQRRGMYGPPMGQSNPVVQSNPMVQSANNNPVISAEAAFLGRFG